jgi:MoaA/NifB/PqqE/SkfB family radical SAM enzyme
MPLKIATIDFHVTCECSQECPYCWGPQGFDNPVNTAAAFRIISRVKETGARRIVFTGGDPFKRSDIGELIRHAKETGLEVAVSTTGDQVTPAFLKNSASYIDLLSIPLDGSTEEINSRTKEKGHFAAVMQLLEWLREYPAIDIKLCTPVTRHNLRDIPNIVRLAENYAGTTKARVFYNIFQAFPRAMSPVEWKDLLVSKEEFAALEKQLSGNKTLRINFLSHETLDRLYVMIFPDGSLTIPAGEDFLDYGQFLEIEDLEAILNKSRFDAAKHLRHSRGWSKLSRKKNRAAGKQD